MDLRIERVHELPLAALAPLVEESVGQGFRLLRRLVDDWLSGCNRFDAAGEALFVAWCDGRLAGVCGLNVDPYAAHPRVGRLRHLYVAAAFRRAGVGRRLVSRVVAAAGRSFTRLTLRTDSPAADAFYRALGFRPAAASPEVTHDLDLPATE